MSSIKKELNEKCVECGTENIVEFKRCSRCRYWYVCLNQHILVQKPPLLRKSVKFECIKSNNLKN